MFIISSSRRRISANAHAPIRAPSMQAAPYARRPFKHSFFPSQGFATLRGRDGTSPPCLCYLADSTFPKKQGLTRPAYPGYTFDTK